MANPEQIAKLKQSMREWNFWKARQPLSFVADLRNADLSSADLRFIDFSLANLSNANLSGADLHNADLSSANLINADLSGANLSGSNLRNADLSLANVTRVNLSAARLYSADFSRADLSGANLSHADLRKANFETAILTGIDLTAVFSSEGTIWPYGFSLLPEKQEEAKTKEPGAPNFSVAFHPDLSTQQIKVSLEVLADYFRSCGGIGLKVEFEPQTMAVREPEYVRS